MSDFWARQLGGSAPPPHVQTPATQTAWWQPPSPVSPQPDPSGQYQPPGKTYEELKHMPASEMSQDEMELLAAYELQAAKYNQECPTCHAAGFIRRGDVVGGVRFGTDRCFECGAGSSTLTMSPEAAQGATGSRANSNHTRQTANGGAASGNYGRHHSELPQSYIPTRG